MAPGVARGPTPYWRLPLGGAALLLLLIPSLRPLLARGRGLALAWQAALLAPADSLNLTTTSDSSPRVRSRAGMAAHDVLGVAQLKKACYQQGSGRGPSFACSQNTNKTCEECLKNVSCLWCNTNKACLDYPVTNILPPASLCKLSSARWGVCWVNFEALIITMSVVGGALLLGIAICCCCCCRRKRSRQPDRSEEKAMREREERRIRQEERRAEMKTRHDEIRKKYGLFKEENPYARFENN
ncbi:hypothetical protein H8958_015554 [Nasalis larvatus]